MTVLRNRQIGNHRMLMMRAIAAILILSLCGSPAWSQASAEHKPADAAETGKATTASENKDTEGTEYIRIGAFRIKLTDGLLALFTLFLVIVGLSQAIYLGGTLKVTRAVANATTKISEDQIAHTHQVERAYISCGGMGRFVPEIVTAPTGHPIQKLRFTGEFHIHVNNHGKTPGQIFHFALEFRSADEALPIDPIYSNFIPHDNWIGPGTQSRPLVPVAPPSELRDSMMIVYGRVWYRDIFSATEHWSGFFQNFDPRTGDSTSVDPPSRAYLDWT